MSKTNSPNYKNPLQDNTGEVRSYNSAAVQQRKNSESHEDMSDNADAAFLDMIEEEVENDSSAKKNPEGYKEALEIVRRGKLR